MALYAGFNNTDRLTTLYNNVLLAPRADTPGTITQLFANTDNKDTPSFSWNNSKNTGFFSPSAGIIGLTTNSFERMRIDNLGNVGIGTTNARSILNVHGNTNSGDILILNQSGSGDIMELRSANNPVVTINSAGNIGIGTNNPLRPLQINTTLGSNLYNFVGLPAVTILEERYASGTNAPTLGSSAATWVNRTLNTVIFDTNSVNLRNAVFNSITRAAFTLIPGTYMVQADFVGYLISGHKIRLNNLTLSRDEAYSLNEAVPNTSTATASQVSSRASIITVITVLVQSDFTFDHYFTTINTISAGGGRAINATNVPEIYGRVVITKYQ